MTVYLRVPLSSNLCCATISSVNMLLFCYHYHLLALPVVSISVLFFVCCETFSTPHFYLIDWLWCSCRQDQIGGLIFVDSLETFKAPSPCMTEASAPLPSLPSPFTHPFLSNSPQPLPSKPFQGATNSMLLCLDRSSLRSTATCIPASTKPEM